MIHETIKIEEKGSMDYARLVTYLWDDSPEIPIEKRPLVLICPGGGYGMTSDREAEAIAVAVMNMGVHAAIVRYSVAPAEYPTALHEVARAFTILREHAKEWHIDPEKIVVLGFSAGGHLAASYGAFWHTPELAKAIGVKSEELRPAGAVLCYPVITSDDRYWHKGSFEKLLGSQWSEEMLEKMSLEKQVTENYPKTFMWHTYDDTCVPVENSLLMAMALKKAGVSLEYHLYEEGPHGLSLAKEHTAGNYEGMLKPAVQSWTAQLELWLKNL